MGNPNIPTDALEHTDDETFAVFADMYPHETYAAWPERFWALFHRHYPNLDREDMERLLALSSMAMQPDKEA